MTRVIKRTLYISNNHITENDETILSNNTGIFNPYVTRISNGYIIEITENFQSFIYSISDERNGILISSSFIKILNIGLIEQVNYIKIVHNGPVYSDLDLFEKN